jgi:3-hydroxymyristoyl/3-hydroxydecanoyl-(acyl carrier protein) dehydratase
MATAEAWPEVRAVLPHREPFLFVDRILELSERRIVGVKRFTPEEPFFKGHFPGRPIVPGVILVEGLAQTMAYFALRLKPGGRAFLVGIDKARFRAVVEPGQEVRYEVEIGEERFGMLSAKGQVRAGQTRVADATLIGHSGESGLTP